VVDHYELNSDLKGALPSGYVHSSMNGTFGSHFFKIDKTKSTTRPISIYIQARTKGLVQQWSKITWEVCPTTSLRLTSKAKTLSGVYERYATDTSLSKEQHRSSLKIS